MSRADVKPVGLLELSWCKVARCAPMVPTIANGAMKGHVKNRVRVVLSTEKPPQTHSMIDFPM